MEKKGTILIAAPILVLFALTLACSASAPPEPTATSVPPSDTPAPTATATPVPTSTRTPRPTPTLEPTPAPVGVAVRSHSFEVTVLKARILQGGVYTGDGYYWTANPGYMFIELVVKAAALTTGIIERVPWSEVYIVEDDGGAWYPMWGGFKVVEIGQQLDPSAISVSAVDDGEELISFGSDSDLYLRVIYIVIEKQPTILQFGFADAPMIEVVFSD
ncbi:MAG: hypothetical protein AB1649_17545 [Chloroflexota bacterium]